MITLTDAFCRVNRARGLELLSPEDLLAACQALKSVNLPLELYTFPDSGAIVLRDPDKDAALRSRYTVPLCFFFFICPFTSSLFQDCSSIG